MRAGIDGQLHSADHQFFPHQTAQIVDVAIDGQSDITVADFDDRHFQWMPPAFHREARSRRSPTEISSSSASFRFIANPVSGMRIWRPATSRGVVSRAPGARPVTAPRRRRGPCDEGAGHVAGRLRPVDPRQAAGLEQGGTSSLVRETKFDVAAQDPLELEVDQVLQSFGEHETANQQGRPHGSRRTRRPRCAVDCERHCAASAASRS